VPRSLFVVNSCKLNSNKCIMYVIRSTDITIYYFNITNIIECAVLVNNDLRNAKHKCLYCVNIMKTDQIQIKTHTKIIEPSLIGNVFRGARIAQSSVFCVIFCRSLFLPLAVFLLDIALSGILRFKTFELPL
jgi:hypothetical protein